MKTLLTLILTLLCITASLAQNMGINYKAVIRDDTGAIVANQTIDVRFNILDDALISDYQETHTVTTDANGIVILNIGEGSNIFGNYTLIDWGSIAYKLQTEIDIEQDGSFIDLGVTGFKAVPYALHAVNAATKIDDLEDGKSDDVLNFSSLFLGKDAGLNDDGNPSASSQANANVGIGFQSLKETVNGSSNTSIGSRSGLNNTSGFSNTFIGSDSGLNNTSGDYNTFIGYGSGRSGVSGSNNITIGNRAITSEFGNNNITIGRRAGYLFHSDYSNCIFIGEEAGTYFSPGSSNRLFIESSSSSSPLIYGEFDNDILGFNGDVGIGHQAPLAPLHIKKEGDAATQTIVAVLESATSNRPTLLFSETADATTNVGMSLEYNGQGSNDNKMVFNSTSNNPLFELQNSGDLKILDGDLIVNQVNNDIAIRMRDMDGNPDRVLLRQTSTNDVYVGDVDDNGGNLVIRAGGTNVLHAKSSGFVGIGVTNPVFQLHLANNSAGKPGSATWNVTSDRRLKKDIKPFNDGLETLKKIDPIWFTYNGLAGMPIETNVGTIAQDLQKVAPYLIKDWDYTDDDGYTENYLSVDYGPLTFILVNAVKEQAQEIEALKKTYDNKIKNLEARLLKLEN